MEDLTVLLALFTTHIPWVDTTLKVIVALAIVYSAFLAILVRKNPASKDWTWVKLSLAFFTNVHLIIQILKRPDPPKPLPQDSTPTVRPAEPDWTVTEPPTRPDRSLPPPEPPTAA